MKKIKHIVYPTDFSPAARQALPHALEIARRYEAEVTLFHCRTLFADDPWNPQLRMLEEERYDEYLRTSLKDLADEIENAPILHTVISRSVSAAAGILEYCREHSPDLVVMGTHGRSALTHFFMGSEAEKVVRHAPCPVLTVGSKKGYLDRPCYRRIVVPYDFSKLSLEAVREAIPFARRFGARLDVFYSLEQEVHPSFVDWWRETLGRHMEEVKTRAEEQLARELSSEELEQIELHIWIGDDRSDREIARFARENHCDLIIMSTHGLSGLDRALLGSTTERVVRIADCPVLVFKRWQEDEQEPKASQEEEGAVAD